MEEERRARAELDVRCQRFQIQLEELRGQANQKNYKNQNFDLVQRLVNNMKIFQKGNFKLKM